MKRVFDLNQNGSFLLTNLRGESWGESDLGGRNAISHALGHYSTTFSN